MVAHALMASIQIQTWANGDPLVLAGDFNSIPESAPYRAFRDGGISPSDPQAPRILDAHASDNEALAPSPLNWTKQTVSSGSSPMRSAYAVSSTGEPPFTNFAWPKPASESFRETLDYVWLSKEWNVKSVLSTPTVECVRDISAYPSASEPSDHVMIGVDLSLKASSSNRGA
eukprot:g555.t1